MLFRCLIFLCIAVYTSTPLPIPDSILTNLKETQEYLKKAQENRVKLIHKNATMTSVEIPSTIKDGCEIHNLDLYINLCDSVEAVHGDGISAYTNMVKSLKCFAGKKPSLEHYLQRQKEEGCKTSEESIENLLLELQRFLKHLHTTLIP